DVLRDLLSLPRTSPFPTEAGEFVPKFADGRALSQRRIRVALGDLSVGARVSGLPRPKVAISGGLLFGLMTDDTASKAIFGDELGHIRNGARWLLCIFAFTLFLNFAQVVDFLFRWILKGTRFGEILGGISEDRIPGFQLGFSDGDPYPPIIRWLRVVFSLY